MSTKSLAFWCVLLISIPQLYANWGGDAGGSVATGAFQATGTNQVEMQNESLFIRLYRDRARVRVDYILKNTGDAADVKAGFPCLGLGPWTEIEDYQIKIDGTELRYQTIKGDVSRWKRVFSNELLDNFQGEDKAGQGPRMLWLTSTVHFEKEQTRNVTIEYESVYEYSFGGPSDDTDYNDNYFRYFLSTAASWKGPIQRGRIVIQPVTLPGKPIHIKPEGRFRESAEGFVWEFSNLRPTVADDIEVCLNNKASVRFNYENWGDEDRFNSSWYSFEDTNYFFDSNYYAVSASSTKEGYPANNVRNFDPNSAWAADKNGGIGESITLTLTKPQHIDQIGIIPGYNKSKKIYFANNRIQQLEIAINGKKTITATLNDEYVSYASHNRYQFIDLGPYVGDVASLKLTIKKVYPGSKYKDTCISRLILRKRLKEKPYVHGAR